MSRRTLTDQQWQRIENLVPGKPGDRGASGRDNRRFVDAVLWIVRTGAPWRDVPPCYGNWSTVCSRFFRWRDLGVWRKLLEIVADDPDLEWLMIDASHIKAHPHAAGAKGGTKTSHAPRAA